MAKIDTVNIVEMAGDDLIGVTSHDESKEGNQQAEELFRNILTEHLNGPDAKDIDSFVEDGYWGQGTYQVFLTHSA